MEDARSKLPRPRFPRPSRTVRPRLLCSESPDGGPPWPADGQTNPDPAVLGIFPTNSIRRRLGSFSYNKGLARLAPLLGRVARELSTGSRGRFVPTYSKRTVAEMQIWRRRTIISHRCSRLPQKNGGAILGTAPLLIPKLVVDRPMQPRSQTAIRLVLRTACSSTSSVPATRALRSTSGCAPLHRMAFRRS